MLLPTVGVWQCLSALLLDPRSPVPHTSLSAGGETSPCSASRGHPVPAAELLPLFRLAYVCGLDGALLHCSGQDKGTHQARPGEDRANHQGLRLQALLILALLFPSAERVAFLMDRSRSPDKSTQPSTPTDNINLGPSANPNAKPTDFDFLKVIGKGSFGKVLLAKRKCDGTFYAVKVLHKKTILKKKEQNHIMAERNVLLKNVKHPFLVGLHYSFQTSEKLYFVLDYVNGGELFFHLQRERCFREPRARFYAAEVASAIGYLHSLNIIYRDLKPENILLDCQGHIVLTDFGLCKEGMEQEETTSTFCGTPEYLAPEVLKKQPYDRTVDWWCLGAVLYEMLFGLPPFYSRDVSQMYDNILHKPLQIQGTKTVAACDILQGLLHKEQKRRLGAKTDFLEIKNHVFFSPINWDDLYHKRITPPFNPNVAGPADLRHFDPEFTQEAISASITHTPDLAASNSSASDAFLGFSYAPTEEDI
ncbi:PREDICTED: serine/threonine-protein kinase Sgk2 isoform X1 [Lepidothrix coronata]|uniref:non-specific serine/threonine protein kinase n=2 Tax=Lepidothrix coronata TaxID=321398 RepID=A0A6J0HUS6_9PASS|nr:PREDICTED: serine/threonine-protein kinase Sgk2 isoform X1 [Lepidothrix coronata]